MQEQVIETVMRELLEEQKISNIRLDEINQQLDGTKTQIKNFQDYLSEVQLNVPPIDTLKMEIMLMEYLAKSTKENDQMKAFATAEQQKQRFKDKVVEMMGWILAAALLIILLGFALR